MTPEAALHMAKARELVDTAKALLEHGFTNPAAREAYLAGLQAAQAYIVEHSGRAAKTNAGAHSQFGQLAMREPKISAVISAFLPRTFKLKTIADYEYGPGSDIPPERAADTVEKAGRLVDCIAALLGKSEDQIAAMKAATQRKE
jgi:uncharacterized protein (UPF0332 family)